MLFVQPLAHKFTIKMHVKASRKHMHGVIKLYDYHSSMTPQVLNLFTWKHIQVSCISYSIKYIRFSLKENTQIYI